MTTQKSAYLMPALGGIYSSLGWLAEPLLRVFVGLLLLPHGAQKLFGMFGGGGIAGTAQFLESVGYTPGVFWALVIGVVEFVGGLALIVGLFTRPVALAVAIFMGAAVLFHLGNGFFWTDAGYEYPLLWGIAALFFAIRGGGRYSLDATLGKEI